MKVASDIAYGSPETYAFSEALFSPAAVERLPP